MRILLTGFEPFGGSDVNPSQLVVESITEESIASSVGMEIARIILPVRKGEAARRLIETVDSVRPDAVICLGQASRRSVVSVERVFINLRDYELPDDRGVCARDEPIDSDGPAAFFSTLPAHDMAQAIRGLGIPAELSYSAGAYLCNEVGYMLMSHLERTARAIPAGFIHVPMLPEQAAAAQRAERLSPPSMSLVKSRLAAACALDFLVRRNDHSEVAAANPTIPATVSP